MRSYYKKIAQYFDDDSVDFEERYEHNHVLQMIRGDFRKITEQYSFTSMLEIGCGPGFDLEYFAHHHPQAQVVGIDISPKMVQLARKRLKPYQRAQVHVGSIEEAKTLFPKRKFDLIYCYFGALNTIYDFERVSKTLKSLLNEDGTVVLTFINRWYMFDVLLNLMLLRFKKAFSRLSSAWGGYSPKRFLASTPRSALEVQRFFSGEFEVVYKKGYSILYPAWYRDHWPIAKGKAGYVLWKMDTAFNYTPLRNFGEYSLYVLKNKKLF